MEHAADDEQQAELPAEQPAEQPTEQPAKQLRVEDPDRGVSDIITGTIDLNIQLNEFCGHLRMLLDPETAGETG